MVSNFHRACGTLNGYPEIRISPQIEKA